MFIDGHEVKGFKQESAKYRGVYYEKGWRCRGLTHSFASPEAAALAYDAVGLDWGRKHNFITRVNGAVTLVLAEKQVTRQTPKRGPRVTDQDNLHVQQIVSYLQPDPEAKVKFADIYDAYVELCEEVLECEPLSRAKLSHILTTLGFPTVTGGSNTRYKVGLAIE